MELAMRLAHPLARLITVVPYILSVGQHTGEPFRAFTLIDGESLAATLPGRRRNDLELVCACDPAIQMEPRGEALQRSLRKASRHRGLQVAHTSD
jgi:hypothetical protein